MTSAIRKAFTAKPAYVGDRNAEFLAEACRKATAKDCYEPDQNLKQMICNKINDTNPSTAVPTRVTHDILRRRLNMQNPHKQWLAVDLVRQVLNVCAERMRPYTADLLMEVGKVAVKPNKRGTAQAQVYARRAAIEYLQSRGDEGINVMRMVRAEGVMQHWPAGQQQQMAGFTTVPGVQNRNALPAPTPQKDTVSQVKELIETANSHSTLLQDLILAASSGQNKGNMNPLVAELRAEIVQLKEHQFPALLARLSEDRTPEAETLMIKALECVDILDSCLELESEVADAAKSGHISAPVAAKLEEAAAAVPEEPAEGEGAGESDSEDEEEGGAAQVAAPDLLSFGSDAAASRRLSAQASVPATEKQASQDPFGLSDLAMGYGQAPPTAQGSAAPLPEAGSRSPAAHDDPFMGDGAEPPAAPPANPFGGGASGAATSAGNPFGGDAFGGGSSATNSSVPYGQQPPPQPYAAGVTGFPYQQGPPHGQYGAPGQHMGMHMGPQGYGGPPPPYGQQYGAPYTGAGPYGVPHTGGPPQGYGAPPSGGPPGYGSQPFPPPQPSGSAAGSNPFASAGPPPSGQYGSSATGMPAPGYNPRPMANPFAASSATGTTWNPNGHKDAFNDLLSMHNRMTNPTPPMAQPMRKPPSSAAPSAPANGSASPFGGSDAFDALVAQPAKAPSAATNTGSNAQVASDFDALVRGN